MHEGAGSLGVQDVPVPAPRAGDSVSRSSAKNIVVLMKPGWPRHACCL